MVRERFQIEFRKTGDLRFISHRDLVRLFERLFRRAEVRLSMSEGFHPKARMSFPSALGLGIEGLGEVMSVELAESLEAPVFAERLRAAAPPGLEISRVSALGEGGRKAQLISAYYQLPVPPDRREELRENIENFLRKTSLPVERKGRKQPVDVRAGVEEVAISGELLKFRIWASRTASVRPQEVLEALGVADLIEEQGAYLTRARMEIQS